MSEENDAIEAEQTSGSSVRGYRISPGQWGTVMMVPVLAFGAWLYHGLWSSPQRHSSLMFIGIPAVLAILLALAPAAKTATGGILKGITLALLIVAPLVGEGYLCILMAAPLFYGVGIAVGLGADWRAEGRAKRLSCIAVILVPMAMEGTIPQLTVPRTQIVAVTRIVAAPSTAVEAALSGSLRVGTPLPLYLRIGFPQPLAASGSGLQVGDERVVHFSGAEGDPEGDLHMQVTERSAGHARFAMRSDASKVTQWVRWDGSEVTWHAIDATHTAVTWSIQFERQLDPAWYFAPWERAAVHEAAAYLIAANATPESAQ